MLSWLIGAGLTFIKDYGFSYEYKCAFMSLVYMLSAWFCYGYAKGSTIKNKVFDFYLISALCVCMIISSWFNFIFINKDIYNALIDIRYQNAFSWKNIYRSVELLALFMVGKNAFIYLNGWFVCRGFRFNATIDDNKGNQSGRQS